MKTSDDAALRFRLKPVRRNVSAPLIAKAHLGGLGAGAKSNIFACRKRIAWIFWMNSRLDRDEAGELGLEPCSPCWSWQLSPLEFTISQFPATTPTSRPACTPALPADNITRPGSGSRPASRRRTAG